MVLAVSIVQMQAENKTVKENIFGNSISTAEKIDDKANYIFIPSAKISK